MIIQDERISSPAYIMSFQSWNVLALKVHRFFFRKRPLTEAIEKATKANVVSTKMKRQQKAGKLPHSCPNRSRKVIRLQSNCTRLNETIDITETGVAREGTVQEDQTRNIKNFTTTIQDINTIEDHTEYVHTTRGCNCAMCLHFFCFFFRQILTHFVYFHRISTGNINPDHSRKKTLQRQLACQRLSKE
jgi:hypothetical protein